MSQFIRICEMHMKGLPLLLDESFLKFYSYANPINWSYFYRWLFSSHDTFVGYL